MAKLVKRLCPACNTIKLFRSDVKICGCQGSHPKLIVVPPSASATMDPSSRIAFLVKENVRLQKQHERDLSVVGFREDLLATIHAAVRPIEPLKAFPLRKLSKADAEIAAVLKFSDWHIGQVTRAAETEGFGEFNYEIAQNSVDWIVQKFLANIAVNRRIYNIPQLYIFCEGDMISGDIHEELRRTNEWPVPVQAIRSGELLARAVATTAPHFDEIHLIEVGADNHGRLQPKPQAKEKSANNMSFVVYSHANALLARHGNIAPLLAEGMKQVVSVRGVNFMVEHGDAVRGGLVYGLERERGRESAKRMAAMLDARRGLFDFQREVGFDFLSVGHWHVPSILSGNILVNGSLSGTDEFDHSQGRHSPPAQVSFFVHPTHKLFNWTPWNTPRVESVSALPRAA